MIHNPDQGFSPRPEKSTFSLPDIKNLVESNQHTALGHIALLLLDINSLVILGKNLSPEEIRTEIEHELRTPSPNSYYSEIQPQLSRINDALTALGSRLSPDTIHLFQLSVQERIKHLTTINSADRSTNSQNIKYDNDQQETYIEEAFQLRTFLKNALKALKSPVSTISRLSDSVPHSQARKNIFAALNNPNSEALQETLKEIIEKEAKRAQRKKI